jgi:membrane-bound lytic murein transglycosylase D
MMLKLRPLVAELVLISTAALGVSSAATGNAAAPELANSPSGWTESVVSPEIAATDGDIHSTEATECLKRADTHLNAGRQLYFRGNLADARKEFNQAVDALLNAPETLPDRSRIERRLDEICDLIYRFDVEKLGAGERVDDQDVAAFDKAPIDEISHMTFAADANLAPKLQSELNQISSGIPLELSGPVLGFIHYFSTERGRRTLLAGWQRSGRYRPLIERIFTEEAVPQELVYLAQAESGFLPRAVSYKSAVGMWQFTAPAGTDYNLARTSGYDERLDPEKATRAAARYLKTLHIRYGDWYLAMAAYNCGPGVVDRAVERTGYADYWELLKRNVLPRETASYVPIIVAMTIMAKNPKDYGLENIALDSPVEYDSIKLTASTNLNLIADVTLQPLSVIRELNPSLLTMVAPSGFEVHLPKDSSDAALSGLESVPAQNRQAWRLHHVAAGDTLATIAKSYHLAPERIVAVNNQADTLETGDTLLIPTVYHAETRTSAVHGRTKYARGKGSAANVSLARRSGAGSKHTAAKPGARAVAAQRVPAQVLHRKAAVHTAGL